MVRLEARNANVEGTGEITIRNLLKASLRMRPDRIIVGEVRGEEAIDMLQSLNTGHCGASSGHSNSPEDMLGRLETMVLMGMDMPLPAIRRQIASGKGQHQLCGENRHCLYRRGEGTAGLYRWSCHVNRI